MRLSVGEKYVCFILTFLERNADVTIYHLGHAISYSHFSNGHALIYPISA